MNIGTDLLRRYGPSRPSLRHRPPGGGGGKDPGTGRVAAAVVLLCGLASLGACTALAWTDERIARGFLPAAALALAVGAAIHVVISRRHGRRLSFGMHEVTPMGVALCVLAAATFVCWQLLAHRWGWPMAFVSHRRRRWWQMIGGP